MVGIVAIIFIIINLFEVGISIGSCRMKANSSILETVIIMCRVDCLIYYTNQGGLG